MATESQGSADRRDGDDQPIRIRSCSRVGLSANPPRARFGDWLRRR